MVKSPNNNWDWYVKIREELKKRDKACQSHFGLYNEYVRSTVTDPYTFPSVEAFKRAYPFKVNNDYCKLMGPSGRKADPSMRYYEKARHKVQCDRIGGIWSDSAVNRNNKYDHGVCWTNKEDAYCGIKHENPRLLRPKDVKSSANIGIEIAAAENKCNLDPRCTFKKTGKYSYDCFSKRSASKVEEVKVDKPPKDMPKDITDEKSNIEKYLYNWYVNKSPGPSPDTAELFGKGNRCTNEPDPEDKENAPTSKNPFRYFEKVQRRIRLMDPRNKKDRVSYMRYMSERHYTAFEKEWLLLAENRKLTEAKKEELYKKYIPDFFAPGIKEHIKSLEDDEIGDEEDAKITLLPSIPQSIVNMLMKNIAHLGDATTNKGVLAWHSTGSGKTCTATGVIDSFWDDKERDIIFASSLDAIASNPDYKFHECAMNLYPRFSKEPFIGSNKEETMANIANEFAARRIRFLSFAKLSHRVQKTEEYKKSKGTLKPPGKDDYVDLNKSVLIIDEVHNLFRPLATQRREHEYLEKQLLDPKKYPNLKIVILTATPGDNIPDVLKLLNIIRDPKKPLITAPNIEDEEDIKRFKESIRGMISFFDMSNDLTKFPLVEDHEPIKYPMSMQQFMGYMKAYKTVTQEQQNFDKLAKLNQTNKYWAPPRRYANMLFNFEKDMKLSDFSNKLPVLLENLQNEPRAKHYVYSAFFENRGYGGHGVLAVAKELDKLGYKKLTVTEAKKLNAKGQMPEKRKHYVLAITNEIAKNGDAHSESTGKNLHELIKIYNSAENKNGEYIHVFLASQGFNEGIDLKGVRHIHIMEPLVTWASDKQTLGRAARYCSHADLDRKAGEWKVKIHRYMSDFPIELKRPTFSVEMNKEADLKRQIDNLTDQLKYLDKKTEKKEIILMKAEIAALKEEMKAVNKDLRELKKIDLTKLKNIEETIFKESRERMKSLLIIYQAMKEAAVDCRILQKFHSSTGTEIKCL